MRVVSESLPVPDDFSLAETASERWCPLLPPHRFDPAAGQLQLVLRTARGAVDVTIAQEPSPGGRLRLRASLGGAEVRAQVRAALHLDEELSFFYAAADGDGDLSWARSRGAGRLLRAPTAFEDLVKALLVGRLGRAAAAAALQRLCDALGPAAPSGAHAFPGPAELAAAPASFYKRGPLAGPLGVNLRLIARRCQDGFHVEALRRGPAPLQLAASAGPALRRELQQLLESSLEWEERLEALLLSLPGMGLRATELLLPLLGCYEIFLCSPRLRAAYLRRLSAPGPDALCQLDARLQRFGPYRGLALYLLLQSPSLRSPRRPGGASRSRKK